MRPPPSLAAWLIDGELRGGHTVDETVAWQSWVEEYAERHAPPRPLSSWVISPRAEPRVVTRLRRLFGR